MPLRAFEGNLAVCGRQYVIPRLSPGEKIKIRYRLIADSSYVVKVKFDSGIKLEKDVGYVTNGLSINDTLNVAETDITVESRH